MVMRHLCYKPEKDWYYVNYWYCYFQGRLEHGGATGEYSYSGGSSCGDPIDPITVVFYGGTYEDVSEHACDHGSWCFHDGGTQQFYSYGCWNQSGQSNSAHPALTQYHMRYSTARYWDLTYACDPVWGRYNLATPHHEYWGPFNPVCGISGHSVDDNDLYSPGGFVRGREDIVDNWVRNGPHRWGGYQYWENTEQMRQSMSKDPFGLTGCWTAWSDGWVAFVSLQHE